MILWVGGRLFNLLKMQNQKQISREEALWKVAGGLCLA